MENSFFMDYAFGSDDNELTNFKNPFEYDCVEKIWISLYKNYDGNGFGDWSAKIEFVNGNTKGEQKFEHKTLMGLVGEMENFLKKLNNK